jgi:hypothetical protein
LRGRYFSDKEYSGLINFRRNPPFIFRLGVEENDIYHDSWRCAHPLPSNIVENYDEVRFALHTAYYQAEDQAKAAVRGDHAPRQRPMDYFLFVGPYWTHVIVGPFSEAQLTVRTHKPPVAETFGRLYFLRSDWLLQSWRKLFLLGTADSALKMESVIASTDSYNREPLREAVTYPAWVEKQ